jgi:hypothetical protein
LRVGLKSRSTTRHFNLGTQRAHEKRPGKQKSAGTEGGGGGLLPRRLGPCTWVHAAQGSPRFRPWKVQHSPREAHVRSCPSSKQSPRGEGERKGVPGKTKEAQDGGKSFVLAILEAAVARRRVGVNLTRPPMHAAALWQRNETGGHALRDNFTSGALPALPRVVRIPLRGRERGERALLKRRPGICSSRTDEQERRR